MQNKTDYIFYKSKNTMTNIVNKHCSSDEYIDFKSITKLFVTFALANLVNDNKINYTDKIIKYFPQFKYREITILHIIQHKSGLFNKWSRLDKKTNNYVMYKVTENYFNSKDRYNYVLQLKQVNKIGEFHYNNFAYDILCAIIKKVTNMYVDEYLKKIFFNVYGIKIIWNGNGLPYGGFGLNIRYEDLHKLSNLIIFLKNIKFRNMIKDNIIKIGNEEYIGHSGSGGQYLYFSLKNKTIFLTISCGNPDTKPLHEQLDTKDVINIMQSMTHNK